MIYVNEPDLGGKELDYLRECIETGWISSEGKFVRDFEERFAEQVNRKHGRAVTNGSVALDLALVAIGIGEGDEVILPSFTIISPAASIVRLGATPILVDSDATTWNMRAHDIEAKITSRTKAIVVVHIYGLPADMDPILALAKQHGLKVIEDAAEMHGQCYRGAPCGSFGDISTFSFYANKHITTGEGGMVVTNDDELAERIAYFRNLCFSEERRFKHYHLGTNARFTNLQAAVGLAQLEKLPEVVAKKRRIGAFYQNALSDLEAVSLPLERTEYAQNIYWVFGVLLKSDSQDDAGAVMKRLADNGVDTRPFFYPMHLQPVFREMGLFKSESYPNSEELAHRGFYIPSGLHMDTDKLERVSDAMHEVLR